MSEKANRFKKRATRKCHEKRQFTAEQIEAHVAVVNRNIAKTHARVSGYLCEICGMYHITSEKRGVAKPEMPSYLKG